MWMQKNMRLSEIAIIGISLLMALRGLAVAETPPQQVPTVEKSAGEGESMDPVVANGWDIWYERISHAVTTPFEALDLFFADDILYDETERSRFHVKLGLRADDEGGLSMEAKTRFRIALPRTKNRLHLFYDDAVDVEDADKGDLVAKAADQSTPDVGVRVYIKKEQKTSLGMDAGARLASPSQAFTRLRGRYTVPAGPWELRLSQSLSWFTQDQWTETSEMRWSLPLTEDAQFRSVSRLTWAEKDTGMTPDQSFQLLSQLSPRAGLRLAVDGSWPGVPEVEDSLYVTSLSYRRLMHRKWLFLEVTTGVEFPEERDFEANRFIMAQFEVIFGN